MIPLFKFESGFILIKQFQPKSQESNRLLQGQRQFLGCSLVDETAGHFCNPKTTNADLGLDVLTSD